MHRDSLGTAQLIQPGDVNWMVAGRGIVHSERTPAERARRGGSRTRARHPDLGRVAARARGDGTLVRASSAASLPRHRRPGVQLTVIAGTAFGRESPGRGVLADALRRRARSRPAPPFDDRRRARATRVLRRGGLRRTSTANAATTGQMVVLTGGRVPSASVRWSRPRLMLVGGAALDGPRHVDGTSSRVRWSASKWRSATGANCDLPRFRAMHERIPLPDE